MCHFIREIHIPYALTALPRCFALASAFLKRYKHAAESAWLGWRFVECDRYPRFETCLDETSRLRYVIPLFDNINSRFCPLNTRQQYSCRLRLTFILCIKKLIIFVKAKLQLHENGFLQKWLLCSNVYWTIYDGEVCMVWDVSWNMQNHCAFHRYKHAAYCWIWRRLLRAS